MNNINDNTQEALSIISRNFEIEPSGILTLNDAKGILTHKIREMLEGNVEKLIGILYRIDISQKKIDGIFDNLSKDEIADQIAEAVIERQLLKVQTRKIYKNRENKVE